MFSSFTHVVSQQMALSPTGLIVIMGETIRASCSLAELPLLSCILSVLAQC
jgi:hypothetical protein